jgi:hypothetical protein
VTRAVPTASLLFAAALCATGCLDLVASAEPPECEVTADCNAGAGEVCDEGVCWGDPPAGQYALVVGPPSGRYDLTSTEVTSVSITEDGWLDDVHVEAATLLHGTVSATCADCREGVSIGATITVRRASRFPGGPEFLVTATSLPDITIDDSFAIPVPPIGPDDPPYQITIEPSAKDPVAPGAPNAAEVVPPLRTTVTAEDLANPLELVLAADESRIITGRVVTESGAGVPGMRVNAIGLVDPLRPVESVSTTSRTDADGWFTLLLGAETRDVVDIQAVPDEGVIAPVLVRKDLFVGSTPDPITLEMPTFPGLVHVRIPVVYTETNGAQQPVPGARVRLETRLDDVLDPLRTATFTVSGLTGPDGWFDADVIPADSGVRAYKAFIVPPADSIAASTTPESGISVGTAGGNLQTLSLPKRSVLTGVIVDAEGQPVDGETVTATPAISFAWVLDESEQQLLRERTLATAQTHPDGTFTLWVDPAFNGLGVTYDLVCEPPELAGVPRWTRAGVDGAISQDIGVLQLPDAAHVRGHVFDPAGDPIADAVVKVYEIPPEDGVCALTNAPADCEVPAILRASGRTDALGTLRVVLPR